MKITKNNALEEVTRILKEMKCVFSYDDLMFEIMVGSESCFIQVEIYDALTDDDSVVMQFYDNAEDPLFEINEDIETSEYIEEYCRQIVDFTKEKVKIIKKINNHINIIKELCDSFEPQVDYDRFISVNYDFDEYNR